MAIPAGIIAGLELADILAPAVVRIVTDFTNLVGTLNLAQEEDRDLTPEEIASIRAMSAGADERWAVQVEAAKQRLASAQDGG